MRNETYKMMVKVSEHIEETNEAKLVEMYNSGRESEVLAKLFIDNYGIINKVSSKYLSIEGEVADSIALESLEKSIENYSINGKSKLSSYFVTIYKRDLVDEYRKLKADKRKIDDDADSVDYLTDGENGEFGITYETNSLYHEDELTMNFDEMDFLTPNEKKILNYYKKANFKCNQKDVAEELGVKPSSISRALKRLEKKKEELLKELY